MQQLLINQLIYLQHSRNIYIIGHMQQDYIFLFSMYLKYKNSTVSVFLITLKNIKATCCKQKSHFVQLSSVNDNTRPICDATQNVQHILQETQPKSIVQ